MENTPKWLPDGSNIDPESIPEGTVIKTKHDSYVTIESYRRWNGDAPIIGVYADVTPPRPDPRVGTVASILKTYGILTQFLEPASKKIVITLDKMNS